MLVRGSGDPTTTNATTNGAFQASACNPRRDKLKVRRGQRTMDLIISPAPAAGQCLENRASLRRLGPLRRGPNDLGQDAGQATGTGRVARGAGLVLVSHQVGV